MVAALPQPLLSRVGSKFSHHRRMAQGWQLILRDDQNAARQGSAQATPLNREVFGAAFFKKLRSSYQELFDLSADVNASRKSSRQFSKHSPARHRRAGFIWFLLPVLLAAARPDEAVALAAFIVEEVGVNRCTEARVIQLDRDIIAPLGGAPRPSSPDLSP